jgi:hypothetical protein
MREQVVYGHWADYMSNLKAMNDYGTSKGWPRTTTFAPLTGVGNEVVHMIDFDSLAALESAMQAWEADAEFGKLFRSQAPHIVQGSSTSEILITLD